MTKSNKQIFDELKKVLKSTDIKISYRNRDGKEYVFTELPFSGYYSYNNIRQIILTAWPKAYVTSGSMLSKTFRIN